MDPPRPFHQTKRTLRTKICCYLFIVIATAVSVLVVYSTITMKTSPNPSTQNKVSP